MIKPSSFQWNDGNYRAGCSRIPGCLAALFSSRFSVSPLLDQHVAPAREERPFNREFAITRTSSNTTSSSSFGFLLNRERRGEERMTVMVVVERFSFSFFSLFFFVVVSRLFSCFVHEGKRRRRREMDTFSNFTKGGYFYCSIRIFARGQKLGKTGEGGDGRRIY